MSIINKLKLLFAKKKHPKPDEYKVLMAGNIMVAQGWQCNKCKVIRAYNQPVCNCC